MISAAAVIALRAANSRGEPATQRSGIPPIPGSEPLAEVLIVKESKEIR